MAQIAQPIKLRFRRPYQAPSPRFGSPTTDLRPSNFTFFNNKLRDDPEDAGILFETTSMSQSFHSTAIMLRYVYVNSSVV